MSYPGGSLGTSRGLEGYLSRINFPPNLSLVICDASHTFQTAGATAAAWHRGPVLEITGGMSGWIERGLPIEKGEGEAIPQELLAPRRRVCRYSIRALPVFSGWLSSLDICSYAFFLILILVLAKTTPPKAGDSDTFGIMTSSLRMLFWGLLLFEAGETFCIMDFLFRPHGFVLFAPFDLLHSAGMLGMGCLGPWAIFRLVNDRLQSHGDHKQTCIFQGFCGNCIASQKYVAAFNSFSFSCFPRWSYFLCSRFPCPETASFHLFDFSVHS